MFLLPIYCSRTISYILVEDVEVVICVVREMRRWIASGFIVRGFCGVVALAMTLQEATSHQRRHCEGYDKCTDGDIKPEAI